MKNTIIHAIIKEVRKARPIKLYLGDQYLRLSLKEAKKVIFHLQAAVEKLEISMLEEETTKKVIEDCFFDDPTHNPKDYYDPDEEGL